MARAESYTIGDIDCADPKDALKEYACLKCLSKSQLLMLLVVILADYTGAYDLPDELGDLMSDSACYTCLSDQQMLQILVAIFASLADETDVDAIREKIQCLQCSDPAQVKAALMRLVCIMAAQWGELV